MLRFLLVALALLLIVLALFALAMDALDLTPNGSRVDFRQGRLPRRVAVGTWALEALGLTALFLLVRGRLGPWWLDGLAAGWIAWVFRGPLLVLTAVAATGTDQSAWWSMALAWLLLYSVCGLILGAVARRVGLAA